MSELCLDIQTSNQKRKPVHGRSYIAFSILVGVAWIKPSNRQMKLKYYQAGQRKANDNQLTYDFMLDKIKSTMHTDSKPGTLHDLRGSKHRTLIHSDNRR